MTLTQFQQTLHALYQGDAEYPTDADNEWAVRIMFMKAGINQWDTEKGILWSELWVTLEDAATGDKTITTATLDYDCPTDFRFPGSFVRTTDSVGNHTFWQVMKPQDAELHKNSGGHGCFFTGNAKTGFDLHFLEQPTVGSTINYPYYKSPFEPASASDILEMSDPYFALYFTLGKLHETDGEGDRATLAYQMANERMSAMRTRNEMPAWFTQNFVPDRDFGLGDYSSGGFGT